MINFIVWLIYGFALYGFFEAVRKGRKLIKNKIKNSKERRKLYVRESENFS